MGIDDFNTGSRGGRGKSSQSYIDGGTTINTLKGAKYAMVAMTHLLGESPTMTQWNEYREDIGVTSASESLKKRVGLTYNEIKEEAGVKTHKKHNSRERSLTDVVDSFIKAKDRYGEDFTARDMRSDSELMSPRTVKVSTGHTFNEWREFLGFGINQKEESGGTKYGTCSSYVTNRLNHIDSYDPEADGYVYLLRCVNNGLSVFYIGSSIDMHSRASRHVVSGGDFTGIVKHSGEYIDVTNIDFDVELVAVSSIYEEDGVDISIKIRHQERVKMLEVAERFETYLVLGGK